MNLYAAVDVGSNSLRSLVVRSAPPLMEYVSSSVDITRITQGLREGKGILGEEGICRTCASLGDVGATLENLGIPRENRIFFATESLRSALNAEEVIQRLERAGDMPLRILSGEEEARYTSFGAALAFPHAEGVFDLGGGSLELSFSSERISLPLGAVRMHNLFGNSFGELREYLQGSFREHLRSFPQNLQGLIGVGGTSSALAMMCKGIEIASYGPEKVHGFSLSRGRVQSFIEKLGPLSPQERGKTPGLPPKRGDIIVAGLVVMDELLGALGISSYVHSECDLLWGVLREALLERGILAEKASFSGRIINSPGAPDSSREKVS